MPKDVYYFKHDANASQDIKLKALRKQYGWAGCGWYWYVIEQMRSESNYKLSYDDLIFDSLATDFDVEADKIKQFIDYCINIKLLTKNGTGFFSERLTRDMKSLESIRESNREAGRVSGAIRRLKSPNNLTLVQPPFNTQNTTDVKHTLNNRSTDVEQPLNNEATNEQMLNNRSTDVELEEDSIVEGSKEDIEKNKQPNKNIYQIYEDAGFGTLSPTLADMLRDWETEYPYEWFDVAFKEAVKNGVRRLSYVQAILESWKRDGYMNKSNKKQNNQSQGLPWKPVN